MSGYDPWIGCRGQRRDVGVKSYLNLGCGRCYHPSWTNADLKPVAPDIRAVDLRAPLPFPDASFAVVYHSHVLEHLPRGLALCCLQEHRRILRPGGVLRVVVPDLEEIARSYLRALEGSSGGDPTWTARYDWTMLELLDQCVRERSGGEMGAYLRTGVQDEEFVRSRIGAEFDQAPAPTERASLVRRSAARVRRAARRPLLTLRHALLGRSREHLEVGRFRRSGEVHQWMYDRYSLGRLLLGAGFVDPRVVGARESRILGWDRFHLDTTPDGAVRKPDSLFMEALRPTDS